MFYLIIYELVIKTRNVLQTIVTVGFFSVFQPMFNKTLFQKVVLAKHVVMAIKSHL